MAYCPCEEPARRQISNTDKNPDRPFYVCPRNHCRFFEWEDELIPAGLNPPPPKSPPKTPRAQRIVQSPSTPTNSTKKLIQTTIKRSFSKMAEPQTPRRETMTPEQKARRLAAIEAGLREKETRDEDQRETSRIGVGVPIFNGVDDEEMETVVHEPSSVSDSDVFPTSKRKRLTFKEEEEETLLSTRPSQFTKSVSTILPTAQASRFPSDDRSSSPTPSERTQQKAGRNSEGENAARLKKTMSWDSSIRIPGAHYDDSDIVDIDVDIDVEDRNSRTDNPSLVGSLVRSLGNVFASTQNHSNAPQNSGEGDTSRLIKNFSTHQNTYPEYSYKFDNELSVVLKSVDGMQNTFNSMSADIQRLKQELASSVRSNDLKGQRIVELENEVQRLSFRNSQLEEQLSVLHEFSRPTPPTS